MNKKFDIVIIGAGPNGLNALYELQIKFPEKNIMLIEKSNKVVNNLRKFPDVMWHSPMEELKLPMEVNDSIKDEYNPITSELVRYYENFSQKILTNIIRNTEVLKIKRKDKTNIIYTNNSKMHKIEAEYIISATGIYGNSRRIQDIIGFDKVEYSYNNEIKNTHIVLIGGGNSAVDFISYLLPYNKISWVIRSDTWSPPFAVVDQHFKKTMGLFENNLTIYSNTEIKKIEDDIVTLNNNTKIAKVGKVVALIGYNSLNDLYNASSIKFDGECLLLDNNYETSMKNVYAFGSIMAKNVNGISEPTYIHNGNLNKLNVIIKSIKKKEINKIMGDDSNYYIDKPCISTKRKILNKLKTIVAKI